MFDIVDSPGLVEKTSDHILIGGELGVEHLEGDLLADQRMLCQVHRAHTARPQLGLDLVVADGDANQSVLCRSVFHVASPRSSFYRSGMCRCKAPRP
jgi:hypothetical protein